MAERSSLHLLRGGLGKCRRCYFESLKMSCKRLTDDHSEHSQNIGVGCQNWKPRARQSDWKTGQYKTEQLTEPWFSPAPFLGRDVHGTELYIPISVHYLSCPHSHSQSKLSCLKNQPRTLPPRFSLSLKGREEMHRNFAIR